MFAAFNENKFQTRNDVIKALHELVEPLLEFYTDYGTKVQIDCSGAAFDQAAISLEGFSRPLWGIVPFVIGGGQFEHWQIYRDGLSHGTDPDSPLYWGNINDYDQRQVELAAIGFGLATVKEHFWDPLDNRAKSNVIRYLQMGAKHRFPDCNWHFFRVLIDFGLHSVGAEIDETLLNESLNDVDSYYRDDGWYVDGNPDDETHRIDYYNPFALHLYGLIYTALWKAGNKMATAERSQRYLERSRKFSTQFTNFFSDDGANIPYGRSLTYRFACGSFWGALAFVDALTPENPSSWPIQWGEIKGLYLRHLRWWADKPIGRDKHSKILSIGYAYPNTFMSEQYNSACSPYWAMKAFLPLAVGENHPFWSSKELPIPDRPSIVSLPVPGLVFKHEPKNTVMLVSGSERLGMRFTPEKYGKFAYSTRYGFSVESNLRNFNGAVVDNMIGLSEDGEFFKTRELYPVAKIVGNILYSIWKPWKDVEVQTWILPFEDWHVRVHKIVSGRTLQSIEGGFSVPRADNRKDQASSAEGKALVIAKDGISGIHDISNGDTLQQKRTGRVNYPEGNVNVLFSYSLVPQLRGTIPANKPTVFVTGILASPDKAKALKAWETLPAVPSTTELERLLEEKGESVGIRK